MCLLYHGKARCSIWWEVTQSPSHGNGKQTGYVARSSSSNHSNPNRRIFKKLRLNWRYTLPIFGCVHPFQKILRIVLLANMEPFWQSHCMPLIYLSNPVYPDCPNCNSTCCTSRAFWQLVECCIVHQLKYFVSGTIEPVDRKPPICTSQASWKVKSLGASTCSRVNKGHSVGICDKDSGFEMENVWWW